MDTDNTVAATDSSEAEKPLVDDDFVIPTVSISEELLWKVKKHIGEYGKLMLSISDTIKDTNPSESDMAKRHSDELTKLLETLDALKPDAV